MFRHKETCEFNIW